MYGGKGGTGACAAAACGGVTAVTGAPIMALLLAAVILTIVGLLFLRAGAMRKHRS
jgi:hypothetical protein